MKTLIQKTVKILFIFSIFISLSDKNYAQRTQVIDFPVTDANNLDLMLLGTPWKVPEKAVSIKIQAWGSGGAGGGGTKANRSLSSHSRIKHYENAHSKNSKDFIHFFDFYQLI